MDAALAIASSVLLLAMFWFMLRKRGEDEVPVRVTEEGLLYGEYTLVEWGTIDRLEYATAGGAYQVTSGPLKFRFTADQANAADPDALKRAVVNRASLRLAARGAAVEVWEAPFDRPPVAGVPDREPDAPASPRPQKKAGILGVLAAIGLLILKFGKYAFGLAKFGPTAISMVVMIGVYAMFFGVWFAVGFVVLIFIHEMGHAVVMWAKGIKTGPIVFLPFFGAFIAIKSKMKSAAVEAEMAYGGPAAGTLAASACYGIFLWTKNPLWLSLAYIGFLLNLFNLIPISPLDGGRVVTAISTKLWVVGLVLGGVIVFYTWNVLLLIVLLLGCARAYQQYRSGAADPKYFRLPTNYRVLISVAYFGLCGYLGYMVYRALPVLEQLRPQ